MSHAEQVMSLIEEQLGVKSITLESRIVEDLGADSLDIGETGIHKRLKISRSFEHTGSNPVPGTKFQLSFKQHPIIELLFCSRGLS